MSNPNGNDEQAVQRQALIRRLQKDAQIPLTAAEKRAQLTSYIASEMDNYPREEIEKYLNANYGKITS